MALIRLARDKRGLDTLYLLQHRAGDRGESRLRVIYFCTSPQGLSFGRQALDPVTQRALEQRYPDVDFDWPALLKDVEQRRQPPATDQPSRRPRPPGKADRRPGASEPTADKASAGKRKRRRGGQGGQGASNPGRSQAAGADGSPATPPPPIIE